jgi:hypothetical protein
MKRLIRRLEDRGENPKIDAFLEEIWAVCEKHGLALSHEDGHGSFLVVPLERGDREWLMAAADETCAVMDVERARARLRREVRRLRSGGGGYGGKSPEAMALADAIGAVLRELARHAQASDETP